MKSPSAAQRVGMVVLLTLASIALHETGHFLVYKIGGYPVRITLQSVRPIGQVNPELDHVALAAGPGFSAIVAVICLLIARNRPSFFCVVTTAKSQLSSARNRTGYSRRLLASLPMKTTSSWAMVSAAYRIAAWISSRARLG